MRRDKLFSGLLLLGIGILFLLDNFTVINFHWGNVLSLWPLLLIISGVSIIFSQYNSSGITIIKILVFVAVFALVVYRGVMPREDHFWGRHFNNNTFFNNEDSDDDDDDNNSKGVHKLEGNSTYNEPYTPQVKVVSLNIRGGGATYNLQDTTNQLFSAATHETSGKFVFNSMATDSGKTINFNTGSSGHSINWDSDKGNQATIKLNPKPEWNIDIAAGASKLDLDLTKFKIRSLHVKGGAASMDLKLGEPVNNMMVDVSTGVSEVNISVPSGVACQIISKTGLSSKSFDGFQSKSDNQYETAGFDAAPKKIYLNLKGGISDFNVKRY